MGFEKAPTKRLVLDDPAERMLRDLCESTRASLLSKQASIEDMLDEEDYNVIDQVILLCSSTYIGVFIFCISYIFRYTIPY